MSDSLEVTTSRIREAISQGDYARAFDLYEEIRGPPDLSLQNLMIKAHQATKNYAQAFTIYEEIIKNLTPDFHTFTLVLNMCVTAENTSAAFKVLTEMKKRNTHVMACEYNAFIQLLIRQKNLDGASFMEFP